jgi:DNA polymerase epsilon subunit 1
LLASALPGAKQWSGHDTLGPDDFELDPKTTGANGVDDAAEALDMHWNIASFLPESIREHFEVVVSEFIFRPWKRDFGGGLEDVDREPEYEVESDEEDNTHTRPVPNVRSTGLEDEGDEALDSTPPQPATEPPSVTFEDDADGLNPGEPMTQLQGREAREAAAEERSAWLAGQVRGYFSQRILRLVGEINRVLGPGTARNLGPQHKFPNPPGAHLPTELRGSPALAFVKTLVAVLSLDTGVEGPVALLRKNALKLLRVPEYAPMAEFREPCVTFVMRDAVCDYCSACVDLDLCRDERLVEEQNWDCVSCGNPYDPQWIEGTLVAHVNERVRTAQLQDLRCGRDRRIKVSHLGARCACGGLYKCVEDQSAVADDLRVMHDIARHHEFAVLKDVVEWVVRSSPNLSHARAVLELEDAK